MDTQWVTGMIVSYLGMGTQWVTGMIVSYLTWHGYSVGHWDDSKLFNLAWVLSGSLG